MDERRRVVEVGYDALAMEYAAFPCPPPGPGDKGLARTHEPSPAEQLRKRVGRVWLENSGGLPPGG